jgi:ABC-type multidrug transport system ATPase subunit
MSAYLQLKQLTKRYGRTAALDGVNLEVERGTVLGLLGPNGAGKSTLFGCLLGLVHPTDGEILFRGAPMTDAARRFFGYSPERVTLYPHQTVWENGVFFAQLRGQAQDELKRQLDRVGLWAVRERKVRQLSKGMLQRLALAIALGGEPELLVLDEPFNGLDPALLDSLCEILLQERERGATLLIATHTFSAIEPLASNIAILLQGQLAAFDSLEQLRRDYPAAGGLEDIYYAVAKEQAHPTLEALV